MKYIPALLFFVYIGSFALAQENRTDQQKPLINADVVSMVKSGLSAEIVIAKIKSSKCAFDTSPTTLADLKKSGVADAVILAIVQCPQEQQTQIIEQGKVIGGYLGVNIKDVNSDLAKVIGLPEVSGALIADVSPNSPAAKAGIEQDDVILQLNGQKVTGSSELSRHISEMKPGAVAHLQVFRKGHARNVNVTLSEVPPALLPSIYFEYARSYYQSKDYAQAIESADKALAFGDKAGLGARINALDLRALAFLRGANDSAFQTPEFYIKSRDAAKEGLQALSQWQKPQTLTDEQYAVEKKNIAIVFNSAAGMATTGLKDYLSAVDFYKAALALNPNDAAIRFRLGAAYFEQTPSAVQDGFWEVSRSIQLKGPGEAPARTYLHSQILRYQGQACEEQVDGEINQLLSMNGSERPGIVIPTFCGAQVSASPVPTPTEPVSVAQNATMPRALRTEAYTSDVSRGLPAEWHQPLTAQERTWASQIINVLKGVPDYPKVTGVVVQQGVQPQMQINAWEQGMKITVPVEMVRFLEDDPNAFAFLVAHEAGHAKQEEIYGQSCYTANNVQMSKFDWVRTLADVAGGAATSGLNGATTATANIQKQACEDNADAWAVHFMRQSGGTDPAGGLRLFSRLRQYSGFAGWRSLTEQFTSNHSIDEVRIAHISALLLRKER